MRAFIIFALITFMVYKVFKFLFFRSSVSTNRANYGKTSTNDNSNVSFNGKDSASNKENKDFKGGEYIDFEEVE